MRNMILILALGLAACTQTPPTDSPAFCSQERLYDLGRSGRDFPESCKGEADVLALLDAYTRGQNDRSAVSVRPRASVGISIGTGGIRPSAGVGIQIGG